MQIFAERFSKTAYFANNVSIRLAIWESTGFVLYYKVLAEEKFKWPKGENDTLTITGQQINWLLDGFE